MTGNDIILRIEDLKVQFRGPRRGLGRRDVVRAVDGVNLSLQRGKTLALVGESGSGKSTTGFAVLQLVKATSGRIEFDGVDLCQLDRNALRHMRRRLQIIFQDSHASLNPRLPVGDIVAEALAIHGLHTGPAREKRVRALMDMVGLASYLARRYPHELSGGQAQRVAICRALAVEPELVICDEPVSALDVSIQAQIVNLLQDLQRELHLTYLFISHDLSVVRHVSDSVAVMYLGKIVEVADKKQLFAAARHPYTKAVMSAVPIPDPDVERARQRVILRGDLPNPSAPPSGCRFRTRCPIAIDACAAVDPPPLAVGEGHWAACLRLEQSEELMLSGGAPATGSP